MRHAISINDFSAGEIYGDIVPGCKEMVGFAQKKKPKPYNPKKKVIYAFFEASTRTRGSYVEAARLLGWDRDVITGTEATSLSKKESIANTARMFALQGADVLVMRTKIEGAQRFAAEILEEEGYAISIQNAGDGTNQHPTQTFLDLLTILEKLGRLDDFKIGFFGDLKFGRTVHSLICALAHRKNIFVVLASPKETSLQEQYKRHFGHSRLQEGDSMEILKDCDIIYGSRIQEERFVGDLIALQRASEAFKITPEVLNGFKKDVLIMHPMPYVKEITPQVRKDRRIIIDDQAWCGIPTRIFLLEEGYKNRKKTTLLPTSECRLEILKEIPLEEYLNERKKRKGVNQYFIPINNGTVIDHIPQGLSIKMRNFLSGQGILHSGVKHLIEDVPSKTFGYKDVIVLEDIFLAKEVMIKISSLAPSVTFNIVKDETFEKIKATTSPIITGMGKCPNTNCITNHDPEAEPKFKHSDEELACYYCEKHFSREEVL